MSGDRSAVLCQHANEQPKGGICKCPSDCTCCESMCESSLAIETTMAEMNKLESLESAITQACKAAGYHFGIGEGCPVAARAAMDWFKQQESVATASLEKDLASTLQEFHRILNQATSTISHAADKVAQAAAAVLDQRET